MEYSLAINNQYTVNSQRIRDLFRLNETALDFVDKKPILKILTAEGCEKFANYIEWLGLDKDPDIVVLSSLHHYYYDAEEIKNVKSVINLKELNRIKQIKNFLHSIFHNLPSRSNFIGCFVDNNKVNGFELRNGSSQYHKNSNKDDIENGIVSNIPIINKLISFMDARTNKYMSKNSVSLLLRDHGFRVTDMTEINGIIYFCAKKP